MQPSNNERPMRDAETRAATGHIDQPDATAVSLRSARDSRTRSSLRTVQRREEAPVFSRTGAQSTEGQRRLLPLSLSLSLSVSLSLSSLSLSSLAVSLSLLTAAVAPIIDGAVAVCESICCLYIELDSFF